MADAEATVGLGEVRDHDELEREPPRRGPSPPRRIADMFRSVWTEVATMNGKIFSPATWRVARLIALGYYDGPTEGFVELAEGESVYRFDMIDPAPEHDLRAIRLGTLPSGTFDEVVHILQSELGPGRWPVWVPRWEFASEERRRETEERINAVSANARPFAIAACDDTLEKCVKVAALDDRAAADIKQWLRSSPPL